jgi:hypothetical protein
VSECFERNPDDGRAIGGRLYCTLPAGHDGAHEAHGIGCVLDRWYDSTRPQTHIDAFARATLTWIADERARLGSHVPDVPAPTSTYANCYTPPRSWADIYEAVRDARYAGRPVTAADIESIARTFGLRSTKSTTLPGHVETVSATIGIAPRGVPVPQNTAPHYRCPKCRAATTFTPAGPPAPTLAASLWRCHTCSETTLGADLIPLTQAPTVPNARDERRREIDAVLAEDARRFPAFATARRAAVMASCERPDPPRADEVQTALAAFHAYENARGGGWGDTSASAPFTDAWRILRDMSGDISIPVAGTCWRAYERARSLP